METSNGLSFNCAESVMIRVNRALNLDFFNHSCLRIASVFGGGVAGCGEVCGAVSGAAMAIGLKLGTSGDEEPEEFSLKREKSRNIVKQFVTSFSENWGSIRCEFLLSMDKGEMSPVGSQRISNYEIRNRCNEYVSWSSKKVIDLLDDK